MNTLKTLFLAAIVAAFVAGCTQNAADTAENAPPPAKADATSDQSPAMPEDKGGAAMLVDFTNDKGELVCPVSGDVIASKDAAAGHQDYNGKRYYFCCGACPPAFEKDPDKFAEGKAIASGEAKSMH